MNNVIKQNISYTSHWWKNNLFGMKDFFYTEKIHYYHLLNFFKTPSPSFLINHMTLIDIGFGTGTCIKYLTKKYKITTIGLDISSQTVSLYNRKLKNKKNLHSIALEIDPYTNNLSFKDSQISFVICSHVLEHVSDDEFLLKEIYRILKKDGYAYFAIPINEEQFLVPNHVRKYTPLTFKQKLEKYNFKLVSDMESDNFSYFITSLALKKTFINNVLKKALIFFLSIVPLSILESLKLKKAQYIYLAKK